MIDPAQQLQTYGPRGAVLDANLLLLVMLGGYDRRQISTNKRLASFSEEDFNLLIRVLQRFARIITTPNILTEVSNLSNAIAETQKAAYFRHFANTLTLLQEEHIPSKKALGNRWARFGLTDAAIAEIANNGYLVLTDDLRLSYALQKDGIATVNFNQLRDIHQNSKIKIQ